MLTVTGLNCSPIGVPPGPDADPLADKVTAPGATASNSTAPSNPVPVAPVASADRVTVMSTRPGATCCVNVAVAPPDRMKLPSFTPRTRNNPGSKVNVSVTIESRDTFTIDIGTVYGPAPTRNDVPGGVRTTWANPSPDDDRSPPVVGAAGAAAAGGGTSEGKTGLGVVGTGCGTGVCGVGTSTVPGTGVVPGGTASCVPGGGVGWPVGAAPGAADGDRGADAPGVVVEGAGAAVSVCCG